MFEACVDARKDAYSRLGTLRETLRLRRERDRETAQAAADEAAVDRFAAAMKAKLAKKRADGRRGWANKDNCSNELLSEMLREHVDKGDPVDVGNFAMMIHQRQERIA